MISPEEIQQVGNDKLSSCTKSALALPPKLRKNKRIETRWGQKYYATVREAVFMKRATPYMPPAPPPSIVDESDDCQPLYACKQCGDCFHFPSSLEAHNSRRSWILGYWCQNCFLTDCSHMQSGQPPCFDCQAINRQRKTYLRAKGLRKGRKMGSIKIFYNQCQFYAHLNDHQTNIVDMADVMLMPLPLDVKNERYAELERLCETLLEHMFLTRTHIMDWFKSKKVGDNWWNLAQSSSENDEKSLAAILTSSGLIRGRKKTAKSSAKPSKQGSADGASPSTASLGCSSVANSTICNSSSSISETIEAVIAQSTCSDTTEPLTETEDSETPPSPIETPLGSPETMKVSNNPCTTADIAFVDCGQADKAYQSPKDSPKITSTVNLSRSRIVNLTATKAGLQLLSKISENPLKLNQTNNLASAKPASSSVSLVNQGFFEPKITVKKFAYEHSLDSTMINNNQNSCLKLNNQAPQVTQKLALAPSLKLTGGNKTFSSQASEGTKEAEKTSLKKTVTQYSPSSLGPRILTVHSPKIAGLSQIIEHLPSDVTKIVFIGQDPERISLLSKSEALSNLAVPKIPSESEKSKIIQTLPTEIMPLLASHTIKEHNSSKISSKLANKNILTDPTRPKMQQIYLDGKFIYQNGKKFVIRHTRKTNPESTQNSLNNIKLQTVPKRITLSSILSKQRDSIKSYIPIAAKSVETGANKISSVTPFASNSSSRSSTTSSSSLSPPLFTIENSRDSLLKKQTNGKGKDSTITEELPSRINSLDTQVLAPSSLATLLLRNVDKFDAIEYFSIDQDVVGWLYIDFSKGKPKPIEANKGLSWSQVLIKYKQQVSDNMFYHGRKRSKQLVQYLKEVNSEYSKIIGVTDDARILVNSEAIKEMEKILNEFPPRSDHGLSPSDDDINKIFLGFQETTEVATMCTICKKPVKTSSHTVPSMEAPVTESGCCRCNNYICHICNVFQGNMSRLIGHLNFHAKREPFGCPECLKKFTTMLELEIHVWTTCFHLLARRWFKCRICQFEGFPDIESLTKHFILAHSKMKFACRLCGILLRSQTAFKNHSELAHPTASNSVPVNLLECGVGKYLVRLEQYKSHLNEHVGVIKLLYYKCPLCSFLVRETDRGKELMKHHLHNSHSDQLAELVSPESLPAIILSKNSDTVRSQSDIDPIEVKSDEVSKCETEDRTIIHSDQVLDRSKSKEQNKETFVPENIENNLQTGNNQSPADKLNVKLNEQTLEDGISVSSINSEQSESPQATDSERKSPELGNPTQKAVGNRNNVIAEYSLSPQIFDVRSVTPDSYAELETTTKEQIDLKLEGQKGALKIVSNTPKAQISEAFEGVNTSEKPDQTIIPKIESKDSVFMKLGEQLLPVKLPQVIVINQADTNMNLREMFQPTMAGSNMFLESQGLEFNKKTVKSNTGINLVELAAESTDEKIDESKTNEPSLPVIKTVFTLAPPPASGDSDKITGVNTAPTKLLESVEKQVEQSVDSEKAMQFPVSVLRINNKSTLKTATNIFKESNRLPNLEVKTPHESELTSNSSANNVEHVADPLLCDVPKPPPLARIPRLIEAMRLQVPIEEEKESQGTRENELKSSGKLKRRRKRPWRIALNAPLGSSEWTYYHCHLCGEPINTSWPVIRSHFNSRHSEDYKLSILTPRLLRMSSEFVNSEYKDVFGARKRKFDGNVPGSKRRKRWSPKKHVEKYPLDLGLCVEQSSVQDREGKFICKKCNERCDDILSLRTHIGKNHRIKDHYLVCLECGENFVVEPSLRMHLKVFHSIKDPCNYLAENTAYAKELTEIGEGEPKTGIANQCHVCMAVFEDKSAVDKHLRVHGMAFLNRKRIEARIAARNPEKKIRMDKPDDSSTQPPPETDKAEKREIGKTKTNEGVVDQSRAAEIRRPSQDKSVE